MKSLRIRRFVAFAGSLLALIAFDAQAAHFDGRYVVRSGDFNGDGRTDLYVRHNPAFITIPLDDLPIIIPRQREQIDAFLLQQTASGSFTLVSSLTSAQHGALQQWPQVALERMLGDFNADGRVDMLIKGVSSVAPGALDPLVFAPLAPRGLPRAVRTVDTSYRKFVRDVAGRLSDPAYFQSGWTLQSVEYVSRVVPTWDCHDGTAWLDLSSLNSTPDPTIGGGFDTTPQTRPSHCNTFVGNLLWHDIRIEHWVFNPANFSSEAITFLQTTLPYLNSTSSMPLSTAQSAVDQLSAMLQVQYGSGDGFEITYDVFGGGAIGGIPGVPLPRPGAPPTVLPPVFIPGTPENTEWGDLFYELLRRIAETIETSLPERERMHDCLAVTEANVRSVLSGSPMETLQPAVSAREIEAKIAIIKYKGVLALPPIKVDSFVIVDGNHRFIAAKLCRTEMPQQPWTAPFSLPRFPIYTIRLDP
jgi:hypothetical protein